MYSHYWSCSRRPDYRRFTMAGGEAPVHLLDSGGGRTPPYHAAADHDHHQASCASRPKPEGSLSAGELREQEQEEDWQWEGHEEEQWEELQQLCRRCHIVMSQLRRQAAALTDRSSLQDPAYASFLFEELQHLQWPGGGHHTPLDVRCDVCDASFLQLRRLALRHALCIDRKVALQAVGRRGSEGSWGGNVPPSQQQRLSYKEQEGGAPWVYGGVQSPYLGGGGVKGLATVTPLSLGAQHHLEGVWRVTCCQPEVQKQTTGLVSDRVYVTTKSSSPDTKPAVHSIATQTSRPPSAAAAFFIRAAQKLSLSRRRRRRSLPGPASPPPEAPEPLLYTGGFSGALQLSPPTVPPCLLRAGSKVKEKPGMGKVRVMVRVCSSSSETPSLLRVDGRKKQLTLCQSHRRSFSSPPKIFPFDAIFSHDASQAEVCSGAVTEVIQSVVNGADGCIFCYGHADLGKTYTMIGRDCSTQSLGVAPTAISWLFKVMEERREKSGVGFSVRVSAVEISGREETLTDLLFELCSSSSSSSFGGQHQEDPGPAVSLCEDPLCGSQLQNQTELRATNAERAAFFLDVALAARSSSQAPMDHEARQNSHFLFTLHLHQERADKSNKAAVSGRSRLHLLDLGSCETDLSRTREGGGAQCLSLSALGNVILALANGAKHVPFRDSKLTMLLRESLGNINCQTTMIAHISDSPANYLETLTTVQLASCIHRTRKKSKHASSSSGGESSCEEGPPYRPPHLRSLHPRTVALDPDTPLLLSSDPDYSSSSEHSCDTVIYVGPGGAAISAQEVSDDEGPSFIPIIPSLNKKRRKDEPKPDVNHFMCNTFAELQERLDCIDGSEGPAGVSVQAKAAAGGTQAEAAESTEPTSLPKPDRNLPHKFSESMTSKCTNKPVQEPSTCPSTACLVDASRITSADGEKHLAPPPPWPLVLSSCGTSPNSEPVMRETAYLKGGVPEPSPSPSLPRTSRASPQPGMSQLALRLGQPDGSTERLHGGYLEEVRNLRAALFGKCLAGHFLRTTVTLQQPVELNGEDELVFTLVEELPSVLVPHNGRPSNLLSSNRNLSLQTVASGLQPISIISSINDEYDVYMSQQSTVELGATSTPTLFHNQPFCFPEQDSSRTTPNKPCLTQHADPTKASWLDRQARSGLLDTSVLAQTSHHASSLPRTTKPTSSAATSCSRQGGQQVDLLLQRRDTDPWESVFGCASKPSRSGMSRAPSRRPGGQSNSVPRPPKVQGSSSAQRVVDGCERSSVRRGETLIKLPRLSQDTTTLGTISVPLSSEVKWGREGTSATGTLKFSSLGKKSNLHKNVTIFNIFPPAQKSSLDQKSRGALPPSALKTSGDTGKSSVPKTSTSEEEFHRRIRADSFRRKTSASRTGSARTSLSLKTHGAKAESTRCYSSPNSLEQSDSQTSAGSRFFRDSGGSTSGGNNRSNRSHLDSAFTSSFQDSPGASEITIQAVGQDNRESSSRVAASNESKVQTLPTSSSKSLRSVPEAPDDAAGRNTSLPLTGKSQTRLGTGVRRGGGTIIGTKRAISRVANRCVSELAAVTQRKQLSRSQGVTGSDSTDSGTSSVSESLLTAPLPSPYSKITAPRRPQRCSSGHGSDNSSILSGELPPAMGRTALFYHSGGSSGYESMMRDSETTGSTSSAHDSMSERGVSSSNRSRAFKSTRKRGNGFQRRRLIPASLPDTSLLEGKVGGQWVDHPPLRCSLKEPFEIKVYEIDDVECMQRSEEQPFHDVQQGLLYFNARLRMLERRQQRIAELQIKHQGLQAELEEAKTRLVLQASRWSGEFSVDQDLDQDSQEYLEALAQVTAELEDCVNFCKSHLMMETCFDITVTTAGRQEGQQEVEL